MKYSIQLTDVAKKMLKEISDIRIKKKIGERIDKLSNNPDLQGKSLKGILSGYRSVRAVGQRYRIVYKIEEEKVFVYIIGVGIRKEGSKGDIYARLKKLIENIQLPYK
ncbi:MAG: type II toxin-antitoxin system RelE/ParE family toxin [bacterium]